MSQFIKELSVRRTIYALSKENFPITNDEVVKIVQDVIALTPSSFNSQTNRAVVLFGAHHDKLWATARANLQAILPADKFEQAAQRVAGFSAAYGTVLFFEDVATVKAFEEKVPMYAANFAPWAEQSAGSAQISTWTALANRGVGVNLQHYNAVLEKDVAAAYDIPANWKLSSQLVFGTKAGEPNAKTTLPATETVKVFN